MADDITKKEEKEAFPAKCGAYDPKFDKYKNLLLDGETIKEAYDVGFLCFRLYVILFTGKRLILLKKIPRNVIELDYKDIELVEFYTNIEWLKMFYAILIYVLLYQIFININVLLEKVIEFVPPLEPLLYAGNFFGMNMGTFVPSAMLFVAGTYFAGLFVLSAIGRLRILIYDQPPFDIATIYDSTVTKLIHTFSELSEKYRSERERRRQPIQPVQSFQPAQPAPPVQPAQQADLKETKPEKK